MTGRMKGAGIAVAAWDMAWKAAAIRQALRRGQKRWVLPLLLVNSAGVLPILYLALWARRGAGDGPTSL